ncbi:hypothetical protein [uncultured Thiohalocapsa sp.]|uniref:hypothetical protein n=1 Tax=uncultured Thiohalocapsa sp. TaxID=768990 RepID=UPI0025EA00BD|nr:hypothetical protein [uncultured Thiohalocapsa sp.]
MDFFDNLRQPLRESLAALTARAATSGTTPDALHRAVLAGAALVGLLLLVLPAVLPGLHTVLLLLPCALAARAAALTVATGLAERHRAAPADPAVRAVISAAGDVCLYLPLAAYPGVPAAPVVVLVVLGLLVDIAGLAPLARGDARRADGPMNTGDRAIVFAIIGLILALDAGAAGWLPWLLLPAAVLAAVTVARRLRPGAPTDA